MHLHRTMYGCARLFGIPKQLSQVGILHDGSSIRPACVEAGSLQLTLQCHTLPFSVHEDKATAANFRLCHITRAIISKPAHPQQMQYIASPLPTPSAGYRKPC